MKAIEKEFGDALTVVGVHSAKFTNEKDADNIRAAEAYWVTGATLHYVTLQHEQKQAPLDLVDRALSYRLNRERHVDFQLPAADW